MLPAKKKTVYNRTTARARAYPFTESYYNKARANVSHGFWLITD
jgi:hypothetical protein